MKKLLLILIIGAVFLPLGPAQAGHPDGDVCYGDFAGTYSEIRSVEMVGEVLVIVQYSEIQFTGCMDGIYFGENTLYNLPNGTFRMRGEREFEGTVAGKWSGSIDFFQLGKGDSETFTVTASSRGGTDDFTHIQGKATASGDLATNSGTYSFTYFFKH